MYKFVKLVDIAYNKPLEYGWLLEISDPLTLSDYEMDVTPSRARRVFSDMVRSREFAEATTGKTNFEPHIKTMEGWAILLRGQNRSQSPVLATADFFEEVSYNRSEMLREYGTIYVQKTGSYFMKKDSHRVLQIKTSEDLIFPDDGELRFIQWPNGKHWYAKIGDLDVKRDGQSKWDTKEEAEIAADKYLRELR